MSTVKITEQKEMPVQEYLIQSLAEQIERLKDVASPDTALAIKEIALAMATIARIV